MGWAVAVPVLLALLLAVGIPSAGAQSIPTLPPELEDTANHVVGTVKGSAEDPVGTTKGTVRDTVDAVGGATGGSGGATGGSGGSSGGGGGSGPVGSVVGGSPPQSQSQAPSGEGAGSGTRSGAGNGDGSAGGKAGGKAGGGASRRSPGGAGGASSSYEPAILPGALAASPVTVVKTNDADGDGTFTQRETAPEPGEDVPFRIAVRNTGSGTVTILGLAHYLPKDPTSSRVEVCPRLAGTTVEAGGSAVCAFTLRGYSPPRGAVKVSTAAANVMVNSGAGRGTVRSLYATTTVQTGAADVSGLGLPGPGGFLAETGADILQLVVASFLLAGIGAELLRRGRRLDLEVKP
jgi:hypothetical protein